MTLDCTVPVWFVHSSVYLVATLGRSIVDVPPLTDLAPLHFGLAGDAIAMHESALGTLAHRTIATSLVHRLDL